MSYKIVSSCCMHVNVPTPIQLVWRVCFLGPHICPARSMCSRSALLSTSLCSWSCRCRCSACACRSVKYWLTSGPGWRISRNYRRERRGRVLYLPSLAMYSDSGLPFCSSSYIVYICSDVGGGPIGAKNLSRNRVPPWLPHHPCTQPRGHIHPMT